MSYLSESLWREGFNMDSSIFSDDDFLDWRWPPASLLRRCDRECANATRGILGMDYSTHGNLSSSCSCSSSSSSSSNMEELFFYCTEELGSESTSGVADLSVPPFRRTFSINEKRPSSSSSSSFSTTPSTTSNKILYTYDKDFMSSSILQASSTSSCLFDSREPNSPSSSTCVHATTSCRCTYEDYNSAFSQQACAGSLCLNASSHNLEIEGSSSSFGNISSHSLPFDANAPHHHNCHVVSQGGNSAFPPPIASLLSDRPLMQSFKSNGRFVLKKVSNVLRSLFQSTRENGHLRLDLLPCSFDCLESQCALLFPGSSSMSTALEDVPAESISTSAVRHDRDHDHDLGMGSIHSLSHWLRSPSPSTLNYETFSPPSKLQAFAMVMHPKGQCSPLVEESISTSSTSTFQAEHLIKGQTGGNTAMAQSTPHVFALLKLLPIGLGLIVFEIGKSKGGDHVTLYGIYIPKNFGFQSSRATMSPTHHLLSNLCGINSEDPKGKLFPFEDCKGDRYMKGVFS